MKLGVGAFLKSYKYITVGGGGGDREISLSTKSDMGRYWTSFYVAYIKMIPVSRGIRIHRSTETNLGFSKS